MVVATDRYVAEDACDRIRVSYEDAAGRRRRRTPPARPRTPCTHDVPDNVRRAPGPGDRRRRGRARRRAAHPELRPGHRAQRVACRMEGKGVHARWDADDGSLRVYSSTQASTVGARGGRGQAGACRWTRSRCIAPDVGGGFGVKIMHPWPEELLIRWAASALGRRGEVDRGPPGALHLLAPTSGSSCSRSGSASTTRAGCSAWTSRSGTTTAPTRPTGSSCRSSRATQLLGPYKPGAYRVEFSSLYTNTVIVTPYRGAGRPQGVFAMERTMDAIADALGQDRAAVREPRTSSSPKRCRTTTG